ncbi:MAG: hypothetical protein ACRDRH_04175 [Pseudonocardia sp.]
MYDSSLSVISSVAIRDACPMHHRVRDCDDAEFVFGRGATTFEFMFDEGALREFMSLASEALREMDAHRARKEAEADDEPTELIATRFEGFSAES